MLMLTDIQKVNLSIKPLDAVGNPAALFGAPVWASSDPAILTVTPAADGMSCMVTTVGPLGTAQVTVACVASADGKDKLNGVLDIQVVSSEATSVSISNDAPVSRM